MSGYSYDELPEYKFSVLKELTLFVGGCVV